MTTVMGLFSEVDPASDAMQRLIEVGFQRDDVVLMSSLPYPEEAFPTELGGVTLPRVTLTGAALGFLLGLTVVVGATLLYRINTGGMPLIPFPSTAIMVYELTMLCAMLITVGGLLWSMGQPRPQPMAYHPGLLDAGFGVAVECADEGQACAAENLLAEVGAQDVRRDERGAQ